MRARWNDWPTFEPAARKYILDFLEAHQRTPRYRDLLRSDGRWILHSARLHHGGWHPTLRKLGFTPSPRRYSRTRRSDWEKFAADARPIITLLVEQLGCLPTQKDLQAGGHTWLSSAAAVHHGGLISVFERMGFDTSHKKPWSDWDRFSVHAQAALTQAVTQLGFSPSVNDLKDLQMSWVATAAYTYHGGYDSVRQRLGFPPPPHKLRGRGLADWVRFENEFRPIIQTLQSDHGRAPTTHELIQRGDSRFLFAARNHHGGYVAVMRRMGFAVEQKQLVHLRPKWHARSYQWAALWRYFPEWLAMGIMPPVTLIHQRCSGLYAYWNRSRRGVTAIAKSFDLLPAHVGRSKLTYWRVVREALDFYEARQRWPKIREMSPSLQRLRRRNPSWADLFRNIDVTPRLFSQLIERHQRHFRWLEQHQPTLARPYIKLVNRIVIAHNVNPTPPHST